MGNQYFKNKKIWITGASSGIGKSLALKLSKLDAKLVISARNKDKLNEVRQECKSPEDVEILAFDIGDKEEIQDILELNEYFLSELDIVILNAGISMRSLVHDTSIDVYEKMIQVNYLGTVHLSSVILPYFQKKKSGHFVVMSSMAGKFGVPFRSGYSGAKMALHGFFESLRAENKRNNIDVTLICPGFIQTDISRHALKGDGAIYNKLDPGQEKGMPVSTAANIMLNGISKKKQEFTVGGFRETKLANFIHRIFPGIFSNIIAKSTVK